ncbi:hypothetical protein ACLOJK_023849 [Asimina triloba]
MGTHGNSSSSSPMLHTWAVDIVERVPHDVKSLAAEEEAVWKKHSIYKIPAGFGVPSRRNAYQPQLVSFGPYHHRDKDLQPMAEHKERALLHFLGRSQKALKLYIAALEPVAEQLMGSYAELDKEWLDKAQFLKLMIVDGCFMIEVLRSASSAMPPDYATTDPIFSRHGILNTIPRMKRDMLMLENQIPLLVLKTLMAVEQKPPAPDDEAINQLVLDFFSPQAPSQKELGLHVLDVVRKSMLAEDPDTRFRSQAGKKSSTNDVIWPATELQEAGIQFERSSSRSLKDISFEKGVLSLPEIMVDDASESKFLNLMAFEHLHAGAGNEVSSYVSFMDNIIDSERDVILLSQSKIVKNFVGTDKAVAKLFNGIAQDVSIDPVSRLSAVHHKVTDYCNRDWNRHLANLRGTYFRSPWALISLLAAVFVLGLTVIQFVYQVIDFYRV